jgi:hypothetical protein
MRRIPTDQTHVPLACTQTFSGAHGTEENAHRGFSDDEAITRHGWFAYVVFFAFQVHARRPVGRQSPRRPA